HRSSTEIAASSGCAVKSALRISHYASERIGTVRPPVEAVEHGLFASGIHLEYRATAHVTGLAVAAVLGCAIEVAFCIEYQTCGGVFPVGPPAGKAVQHRLCPARIHLKHHSARLPDGVVAVRVAPVSCRSVKVSGSVHDQTCEG